MSDVFDDFALGPARGLTTVFAREDSVVVVNDITTSAAQNLGLLRPIDALIFVRLENWNSC
jgi:hypothetical protein